MADQSVTRIFVVKASSAQLMARFERLMALLHFSSSFGHSGTFGMPLDGDGNEKIRVTFEESMPGQELFRFGHEVDLIGGVGYELELAIDGGMTCKGLSPSPHHWRTVRNDDETSSLLKNGNPIKTLPRIPLNQPDVVGDVSCADADGDSPKKE